jgi:hypothetical protein
LTAPLSGHQVMINGHALCPPFSLVRGCDPGPPGIAVERPQRSEDERPGRSAVSGTAWRRAPRSRNVAGRRASAAPDPSELAPRPDEARTVWVRAELDDRCSHRIRRECRLDGAASLTCDWRPDGCPDGGARRRSLRSARCRRGPVNPSAQPSRVRILACRARLNALRAWQAQFRSHLARASGCGLREPAVRDRTVRRGCRGGQPLP